MTTKFVKCEECYGSGRIEKECPTCGTMICQDCTECEGTGQIAEEARENDEEGGEGGGIEWEFF